jgi:hypothetical protein
LRAAPRIIGGLLVPGQAPSGDPPRGARPPWRAGVVPLGVHIEILTPPEASPGHS